MCRFAYSPEIWIQFFFKEIMPLLNLRSLSKIEYTTETVCQPISSEAAQQNFM